MSRASITELVAICAGVIGLAAYLGLILVPAWNAYTRIWERLAAAFMTLYILAVFVGIGIAGALLYVYFQG